MSLFRRLVFSISLLILFLLACSSVVSVFNARQYLGEQLTVVAEDTATFLGLAISHAAQEEDKVTVSSMVDAIFDRGFYQQIRYVNIEGETVVLRERDVNIGDVPAWFVDSILITPRKGRAQVVSGWYQLGMIEVSVHPGFAYQDLWRVAQQQFWLFVFTAVLSYVLAGLGLKVLLKPLERVKRQAEAICRQEFDIEDRLPRTPELRDMVLAMNRMVTKIKETFEQQVKLSEALRRESYMDPVTELPNRKEFDSRLNAWMKSEAGGSPSVLLLLHVSDLDKLNDQHGRDIGDRLLVDVAEVLKTWAGNWSDAVLARRAGGDFSIFVPGLLAPDIVPILDDLLARLMTLENLSERLDDSDGELCGVGLGVSTASKMCNITTLLSAADMSLREYMASQGREWVVYPVEKAAEDIRPAREWLDYLQKVLDGDVLFLHYQPALDAQNVKSVLHYEVFARIREDNKILNAGAFWPLVERYGFVQQMDKAVIEHVLQTMSAHPQVRFSVNLSPQSATSVEFHNWLGHTLEKQSVDLSRLVIELPEKVLRLSVTKLKAFVSLVRKHGGYVSLDHFGVTPSSMGILQSLSLSYVKLDRRFTMELDAHPENRFYIKSLLQIAHSCDVQVLVDGVETESDWNELKALGVNGGQGYFFAAPSDKLGA